MIKFYKILDPHGYMSNFYPSRIFVFDGWWDNVEAAYQAQKFKKTDPLYKQIQEASYPKLARDLGQGGTMRSDWDEARYDIMKAAVLAKFLQHPSLRHQLMKTDNVYLVEDSPIDFYWGCGSDNSGKNKLGQCIAEVRSMLRGE